MLVIKQILTPPICIIVILAKERVKNFLFFLTFKENYFIIKVSIINILNY